MVLKIYIDLMSQPSRALYILLKSVKCDFEKKLVDLRKGPGNLRIIITRKLVPLWKGLTCLSNEEYNAQRKRDSDFNFTKTKAATKILKGMFFSFLGAHYTDEFTAINRFQKVPVIDHNGFILTESVAIVKYLSRENIIPDSLLPKESKLQAKVDEFLEWQHIGLRLHCAMFFRVKVIDPVFTGKVPDAKTLMGFERRMISSLEAFEKHWLQNGTEFIAGDTITVADLLAACELEQPRAAGYDPAANFKVISTWWRKVRDHFNPYYDEAHVVINKLTEKNKLAAKL